MKRVTSCKMTKLHATKNFNLNVGMNGTKFKRCEIGIGRGGIFILGEICLIDVLVNKFWVEESLCTINKFN